MDIEEQGSRIPKAIRYEVLRRAGHKCECCDQERSEGRLPLHHIIPRSEGGGDNVENLMLLCVPCRDLVVQIGFLRTRRAIVEGPASPPPVLVAGEGDWREWVYGGARNPLHEK